MIKFIKQIFCRHKNEEYGGCYYHNFLGGCGFVQREIVCVKCKKKALSTKIDPAVCQHEWRTSVFFGEFCKNCGKIK